MEFIILISLVLFLSYANGSNDISKGIATLVGSGVTDYKKAILWGTFWTAIGSLLSAIVSINMVKTFGNGLVSNEVFKNTNFLLSVLVGASGWVILSSKLGMPVSTTHAIVGSIVGAGLFSVGYSGIIWGSVINKIFLPLLLSPLLSFALTFILFPVLRRPLYSIVNYCLCLESRERISAPCCEGAAAVSANQTGVGVVVDEERTCNDNLITTMRLNLIDVMHWLSSGFVCMARGMNDTPKIAAIILSFSLFGDKWLFFLISLTMAIGGYLYGLKTTETLSFKITKMDHVEGFTSNMITGVLVGSTSHIGLPVSTTHVSSSSIMACGIRKGIKSIDKKIVGEIFLSWIVTIPVSALISAFTYLALHSDKL
jgi:PiT family inorganic phosphate transporter